MNQKEKKQKTQERNEQKAQQQSSKKQEKRKECVLLLNDLCVLHNFYKHSWFFSFLFVALVFSRNRERKRRALIFLWKTNEDEQKTKRRGHTTPTPTLFCQFFFGVFFCSKKKKPKKFKVWKVWWVMFFFFLTKKEAFEIPLVFVYRSRGKQKTQNRENPPVYFLKDSFLSSSPHPNFQKSFLFSVGGGQGGLEEVAAACRPAEDTLIVTDFREGRRRPTLKIAAGQECSSGYLRHAWPLHCSFLVRGDQVSKRVLWDACAGSTSVLFQRNVFLGKTRTQLCGVKPPPPVRHVHLFWESKSLPQHSAGNVAFFEFIVSACGPTFFARIFKFLVSLSKCVSLPKVSLCWFYWPLLSCRRLRVDAQHSEECGWSTLCFISALGKNSSPQFCFTWRRGCVCLWLGERDGIVDVDGQRGLERGQHSDTGPRVTCRCIDPCAVTCLV